MAVPYRRILVALDGSDDADQVLEAALTLQRRSVEAFHVVTVVPPMLAAVGGMGGAAVTAAWPVQEMELAVRREIGDGVRERAARFGIAPERVTVRSGRPASEIRAVAEELEADLIVIGSHGREGLAGVMLGSTANGVLHGSQCDVLTIRIHA